MNVEITTDKRPWQKKYVIVPRPYDAARATLVHPSLENISRWSLKDQKRLRAYLKRKFPRNPGYRDEVLRNWERQLAAKTLSVETLFAIIYGPHL